MRGVTFGASFFGGSELLGREAVYIVFISLCAVWFHDKHGRRQLFLYALLRKSELEQVRGFVLRGLL